MTLKVKQNQMWQIPVQSPQQLTTMKALQVYNVDTVEEIVCVEAQEGNMKQVEAKLLDFDWIFTKKKRK